MTAIIKARRLPDAPFPPTRAVRINEEPERKPAKLKLRKNGSAGSKSRRREESCRKGSSLAAT